MPAKSLSESRAKNRGPLSDHNANPDGCLPADTQNQQEYVGKLDLTSTKIYHRVTHLHRQNYYVF